MVEVLAPAHASFLVRPSLVCRSLELPLTTVRVCTCGEGPPLIAVPATISLIDEWEPLIRFIGQRYTVHFFELPGYGGSVAFEQPYHSELVARLVEELADAVGVQRFGLVGFSFGGLFVLRTLQRCAERVDRVCLLAPYVGREALRHSRRDLLSLKAAIGALRPEIARRGMMTALRSPAGSTFVSWFMRSAGRFESPSDLRARLAAFTPQSLDVLLAQTEELLTISSDDLTGSYEVACLFGMSVFDTMMDFVTTRRLVRTSFPSLTEDRWEFPYHAPPAPLTLEDYEQDYTALIEWDPPSDPDILRRTYP